jgi:TetR/AcrR family transcriptional repressor of nem operon
MAATPKSSSTADRILDVAQDIIQTSGYSAMTLEEVAERVGIRKPSIMHHYAGKADLGTAVIKRYRARFATALDRYLTATNKTSAAALDFYFSAYIEFGETEDKVCLCGSLASEFSALPASVRSEVRLFFADHQDWLETILSRGSSRGEFKFEGKPRVIAKLFLDSLQGSLIIKRATSDTHHVRETVRALKQSIAHAGRQSASVSRR